MFTKVLISDDLDSINHGVMTVAASLGIQEVIQVQYCDDAYLKLKKAAADGQPFDLLITDLSFKMDHREQKYPSGDALIKAVREAFPNLQIAVYTVEDRLQRVRSLMQNNFADAYVCKGRKGLVELSHAIRALDEEKTYLSPQIAHALNDREALEIDDYDIVLLQLLSRGLSQDEVSSHFKNSNISPSSLSSIEKRLNKLRIQFKANNAIHLVAIVKDIGLI
ncbi:DNA-binding NarL/FixJ family response regulator [Ulvibacter sp. MAR_2010_11]|uniref:response regulator transcription factor n=1 Tax=Ulvibacter sp. MAR_2010_11 TaxID=1250229 RepID=UPI000C2C0C4D|nr:response regulator transcription factor [Ulvibacter sp. MAR_2010_11]PKA82443.1 DNA-binding NarL/FixJ family response regulator [Ulvibacter sp. MAR_2010_11]